ncbi:MAG: hypothetical protein L3J44_05565 [Campylobacteraceae bacterium]|nr:hypothetical protein [Campylobacteraceae bacterium]
MRELICEVTFLSDIVLPATSNTEGKITPLEFIPGSNFLGMVAKNYAKFSDSFAIFHSGAVKFGDGMPLLHGKLTYKTPFSFFHEKADKSIYYNHHKIDDFGQFKQLKQKRDGFITNDLEMFYINYNYSQKSAYDKTKRKSKDSSMYGYISMPKGLKWQFSIKVDDALSKEDMELLKDSIKGKQRLGKSKSAQYGLVEITLIEENTAEEKTTVASDETILYCNSRLALVDSKGNPTYDLTSLFDGLSNHNINYNKCQIRTSSFTPYNGVRKTKDYERICIEKGSVIVLKEYQGEIPRFVGAYQSEGFGEILVNPSFIQEYSVKLKNNKPDNDKKDKPVVTTHVAKYLAQKEQEQQQKLNILNDVDDFIKKNKPLYSNINPSQWGKIRSICTKGEPNFKEEIKNYISSGVKAWSKQQTSTLLDNDEYTLEFIKLISIQMPKQGGNQ